MYKIASGQQKPNQGKSACVTGTLSISTFAFSYFVLATIQYQPLAMTEYALIKWQLETGSSASDIIGMGVIFMISWYETA